MIMSLAYVDNELSKDIHVKCIVAPICKGHYFQQIWKIQYINANTCTVSPKRDSVGCKVASFFTGMRCECHQSWYRK